MRPAEHISITQTILRCALLDGHLLVGLVGQQTRESAGRWKEGNDASTKISLAGGVVAKARSPRTKKNVGFYHMPQVSSHDQLLVWIVVTKRVGTCYVKEPLSLGTPCE
jgi:hypothetical protein